MLLTFWPGLKSSTNNICITHVNYFSTPASSIASLWCMSPFISLHSYLLVTARSHMNVTPVQVFLPDNLPHLQWVGADYSNIQECMLHRNWCCMVNECNINTYKYSLHKVNVGLTQAQPNNKFTLVAFFEFAFFHQCSHKVLWKLKQLQLNINTEIKLSWLSS